MIADPTKIRAAFDARSLGTWPTPLEAAPGLGAALGIGELWLKREDRSSTRYGGNKVRGLEFLLSGAAPDTVFVTIGGTGSTHCLATAVHARALGQRALLAQFPQPDTPAARAIAERCGREGARVFRAATRFGFPVALARAWVAAGRLGSRHWIPGGGATPRAVIGHFLAGLELADQLGSPPDAIVVPFGSTGTAAGLCLAMAHLGWPTRVVGVRVAPALVANRWRASYLARKARDVLRSEVPISPLESLVPVVIDGLGRGYGWPTAAGERVQEIAAAHALVLDPTYGAKALAALPALAARGFRRVVFWHTFATP